MVKQPSGSRNTRSDTTTANMVFGQNGTASAPSAAAARPAQPVPQPISTTSKLNSDKQNSWTIVEDQWRSMKIVEWSMEKLRRIVWSRLIFIGLAAQQPGLFNKASRQQQRAVIENPSDAQRSILVHCLRSQPFRFFTCIKCKLHVAVFIGLTSRAHCCETQCCKNVRKIVLARDPK